MNIFLDFSHILKAGQINKFDFAIILAVSTPLLLRTLIEKAQIGIMPQLTDYMQIDFTDSRHELDLAIIAVYRYILNFVW